MCDESPAGTPSHVPSLQRAGHGSGLRSMHAGPTCTAPRSPDAYHVCAAGESEDELSGFTPSFLWLLRDFYLSLEEDGRKVLLRCPCHEVGALGCGFQLECNPAGASGQENNRQAPIVCRCPLASIWRQHCSL